MSARFKPYPSYKDSGVEWLGQIPAQWATNPLKRFARVRYGLGQPPPLLPDGSPLIRATNINSGKITEKEMLRVDPKEVPESREATLAEGEIIVVRSGAYTGDSAIIPHHYAGAISGYDMVLSVKRGFSPYFAWQLLSPEVHQLQFGFYCLRAAQPHLNAEELQSTVFVVPPLDEQQAIAECLDRETGKIDALVKKKERLIELLQEKRTALISHVVTQGLNPNVPKKDSGVPWLGHIPKHWQLKKLGQVAMIVRGGSPRPAGDPRFFNGDACPWITVAEITKDSGKFLNETETRLTEEGRRHSRFLKAGTLVMSNSGATLGVPKILNIAGCINDGSVAFLDLNPSVSRNYLYCYLSSLTENYRDRIKQGSGQPNLNTAIVRSTWFPVGDVAEQNQIVEFLDQETAKLDALMAKVRTAIERLQEYRTALISAAVTGQIDVRSVSTL